MLAKPVLPEDPQARNAFETTTANHNATTAGPHSQVENICLDKGLTDKSEILKFLQCRTLVGLLTVPHPILIRKCQADGGTTAFFRTYMWDVIYLTNVDPATWYDTEVRLFEINV